MSILNYSFFSWNKIFIYLILFLISIIFFFLFRSHTFFLKYIGKSNRLLLFFIPFFFFLCCFRFYYYAIPSELEELAKQEKEGKLYGTIYKVIPAKEGRKIYLKNIRFLSKDCGDYNKKVGKVLLYDSSEIEIFSGNTILVETKLQNFRKATNFGQYDEYWYQKNHGIMAMAYSEEFKILDKKVNWIFVVLQSFKKKLAQVYNDVLEEKEASIIKAMILGDKSDLEKEVKNLYSENGIAHILAISGLHISMLGFIFYKLFRSIILKGEQFFTIEIPIQISILLINFIPAIISILLILLYGQMIDCGVSSSRAIIMFLLTLLATLVGRTYDLLTSAAFAEIIILLQNPFYINDYGFWLSFGAIFAISVFMPVVDKIVPEIVCKKKRKIEKTIINKFYFYFIVKVRSGLLVSISIFFITLPIVIRMYFFYPLYGIFLNLMIIPLMSILVPMAFFMGIMGLCSITISSILAIVVTGILNFYEWICLVIENLPEAIQLTGYLPLWKMIIYYLVLMGILFLWNKKNLHLYQRSLIGIGICLIGFVYQQPSSDLKVHFLDIGQGDSIVMELPKGIAVTVDGGSANVSNAGEYRLYPFLKASRINQIECAFLTHMDKDHISAIQELLEMKTKNGGKEILIKKLIVPKVIKENEIWKKMKRQAQKKGTKIFYIQAGDQFEINDVKFECLGPKSDFTDSSENAASLIMKICYKEFDLLLTGDVEGKGEKALIENYQKELKEIDVLKVAHHGSKNSTLEEFLNVCCPKISIISCGEKNQYGHPHQELLERLKKVKSKVITTKESGEITIKTNGNGMKIERFSFKSK